MRMRCGRIHIVPLVALAVVAAGWFTALALVACERSGDVLGLNYDRDAGTFKTVATLGGLFRPASLLERVVP